MKYKVTILLNEGGIHTLELTAKTKLAIKLKVNQYQEKHNIDDEDVVDVTWEPIGIPDENEVVL